jgi:BirA family biotin operon repressor/biotin-[acetyl-CoA-carboxylase] ligase
MSDITGGSLLDTLADGEWHSGEALAAAAGVTRAAMAKRVEKLREIGLEVEARQGLGYRLARPLERLDGLRLRAAVPALRIRVEDVVDSTNRQMLDAPAADDPQLLLAEYQTAGRGRRGRSWQSPFGANLYLSLAWSFPGWPPQLTALPLAVGVACAAAMQAQGLADVQLKWPNDLYAQSRKLGGILIEHRGEAGGLCRVVIGIGINVAMSGAQAEGIDQPWISFAEAIGEHRTVSRNDLAIALIQQLASTLRDFENSGFAPFKPRWSAFDLTRDRPVTLSGEPAISGIARGVDDSGALLVDVDGQRRAVYSGDVSLRLAG